MNADKLRQLQISSADKQRSSWPVWVLFLLVALLTAGAVFYAWPRHDDERRVVDTRKQGGSASSTAGNQQPATPGNTGVKPAPARNNDSVLTVSGYIVNRERIELSPRFMGVVNWIGVKKGDAVTNGQVVVLLDDSEYKARMLEAQGRLAVAEANAKKAELEYQRIQKLVGERIETQQAADNARYSYEAARAGMKEIEGGMALLKTYIDWTIIRSPINGVVLEKLVDPNELVVPQSFGGGRGPSTALIALANPKDLQVEIDLNERDLAKVFLNQKCVVSPEAYVDRKYEGYVAEIAPEAVRAKGTLQVKVQIKDPDHFLTPELSAKVDFLKMEPVPGATNAPAKTP